MAVEEQDLSSLFADKQEARRIVAEEHRKMGIVGDSTLSIEQAQAMVATDLQRAGLRRDDNIFSCGIMAARDGE